MAEFLPLTSLKPWCFNGENDYNVIIEIIQKRYPHAPKMLIGLSCGGAYIQSILANRKYDGIFCGGIKIDAGGDFNIVIQDLDKRQPFIGNVLGQFFDVAAMKCRKHKLKYGILKD
eukprot:407635_1